MDTIFVKSLAALAMGAILMLVLFFTVYRQSYYYKKAGAEAGVAAEKPDLRSRLVTVAILLAVILFIALFDLWVLDGGMRSFLFLSALNLGLVALLSLFDGLFIDLFVLTTWRPALLRLPEGQPTREAMLRHLRVQFTAGWIFKLPIAVLGAALASILGGAFG
jgi:hypothetical protein